MLEILINLSKYLILLLMALYAVQCFIIMKTRDGNDRRYGLRTQVINIIFLDFTAFVVLFLQSEDFMMLIMFVETTMYILIVQFIYHTFFKRSSMQLVNNMCMLLSVGFIILSRLDFEKAQKQFAIVVAGTALSFLVLVVVRRFKHLKDLTWIYGIAGIALLAAVLMLSQVTGGANLALEIGGISFQFSELVKITFVFFTAGILRRDVSFKNVVIASVVAAVHVLILVASTDLGGALIYFVTYVVMVYVATRSPGYALLGLGGGSVAAVGAYFAFSHVRARVVAWLDPFSVYETNGYQIVQSLFAICAGGWFGVGLYEGSPTSIPVVTQDFIFAAICEEMGILFAVCLLLVCMCFFLNIVSISTRMGNKFYKLIALGLGTEYAFQVFLTVGGTTKFIPMTGVTLPLVSYGGSSVICTILMIAIIQGLYILREDEGEQLEKQKRERIQERNKTSKREQPGYGAGYTGYESGYRDGWTGRSDPNREKTLEEKIEEETENSLRW